jgi:hypothetical protein
MTLSERTFWFLAIGWTILITTLSLIPSGNHASLSFLSIPGMDKIGHFAFYLILGFLWCFPFRSKTRYFVIVFIFCVSFGILMEFLQFYLSIGRQFEVLDMWVNTAGVGSGIVLYKTNIN